MCGVKLGLMGIRYEDEQEDIADRQLKAVMAMLTIRPSIIDHMRQVDGELLEQWLTQGTYLGLVIDTDGLYVKRAQLQVLNLPAHPGQREDILHEAQHSRLTVHRAGKDMI